MKKIILGLMMVLLIGCNQTNNVTSEPIVEPVESVDLYESCVGTWIYVDEDVSVLYLYEDGTFASNDISLFSINEVLSSHSVIGEWSLEDNKVTFNATKDLSLSGFEDQSATLESQLIDNRLRIDNQYYEKENSAVTVSVVEDFDGEWQRTGVHKADTGYVFIENVQDNLIYFKTELYSGGNTGTLAGIATIISENQALYIHNRKDSTLETIHFNLNGNGLDVKCTPGISNEFGMGVFMDGLYTLDDPVYTNENIMIDTFDTEERIDILKKLLGEVGFSFLEVVMDNGYETKDDDLTYSGFVGGVGYGVNILMTEDNYVYCLIYGQEDKEVYYSNDPKGKGLMHPYLMDKVRDFSNIRFVYDDNNEVMIYDEYVWINGQYSKPNEWNNSITWERDMSEYVEVIVSDEIYDFQIVSLDFDDDFNLLYGDPIFEIETLNQTFAMNTYHPEGVPSEAIVFKDKYGKEHSYVISERTLRGELFDLNELIIPLNYMSHERVIKTYSDDYITVPYLNYLGDTIESYVPEGWQLLDSVDLDFNGDGTMDKVGVIEKNYEDKDYDTWDYPRILFALRGSESGYILDFEDINLVRHSDEGGVFGDPYLPLTTDGKDFEINTFGGSAWKWSERSQFTYIDGIWYLREKEDTYGYGPYITDYSLDYYDLGYGIRKHNNQDFDSMETGDSTDYELEFEITLNKMQSLVSYSESWWLTTDRLGQLHLSDLYVTEGVSPLDYDEIIQVLNDPSNIKDMNQDYIMFHVRSNERQMEHILRYNRRSHSVNILLDAYKSSSFYEVFDQVKLGDDGLYYIENHIVEKDDKSYIEKASIHRLDFYGKHEVLTTIDNVPVDGEFPYFSVYIESLNDEMIYRVFGQGVTKYYRLNYDNLEIDYLGQVTNE